MTMLEKEPVEGKSAGRAGLSGDAVEFLVVMGFAFLPTASRSVMAYCWPSAEGRTAADMWSYLPMMAQMVIPILYIVHLRGRRMGSIGLGRARVADIGWALLAFIGGIFGGVVTSAIFLSMLPGVAQSSVERISRLFSSPGSGADILMILLVSVAVGFGEELFFRGYLVTQWRRISGSTGQAVWISAVLFGVWHAYQGAVGMVSGAALGFVYALVFVRVGRIWPLVLAHAVTDFIAFSMK